ncbi:Protein CBG24024 [Caenorhabditis briggsae]|uniref:Protein CBG24024 n=1 Tax=Caenorhabditis briggsae TaxID=6238 RepID=A8WJT8_CAEBR|nr:Protein CBG24024 [Caenorhabditis briggsae]CAP20731.1 Protein CBG24024 [Caenorhabditis briggsae]
MMVAVATISIFENRFFLLFAENSWWRHGRKFFYLINYSLALLYFLPTVLLVPDQDLARKEVFKMYPKVVHFHTPDHPIYVVAYDWEIREWIGYRQLISLGTVIVEGSTFLFLLHFNIWWSTKRMTMSQNTLGMQRRFLKAVYMQIAIPATIMIVPQIIMILLGYLYLNTTEMNSIAYMLMAIHERGLSFVTLENNRPRFSKYAAVGFWVNGFRKTTCQEKTYSKNKCNGTNDGRCTLGVLETTQLMPKMPLLPTTKAPVSFRCPNRFWMLLLQGRGPQLSTLQDPKDCGRYKILHARWTQRLTRKTTNSRSEHEHRKRPILSMGSTSPTGAN